MFTTTAVVSTIGTLSLPAGARVVLRCRVNEWLINARRVLGSVGWLPAGVRCSCMAPKLPSVGEETKRAAAVTTLAMPCHSVARFRFTVPNFSCPAGAVPNSYPKLDLLWDNLIAGPWGWPHSTVLAKSRPVTNPSTGRDAYRMREPTIPVNELSTSGSGQFD